MSHWVCTIPDTLAYYDYVLVKSNVQVCWVFFVYACSCSGEFMNPHILRSQRAMDVPSKSFLVVSAKPYKCIVLCSVAQCCFQYVDAVCSVPDHARRLSIGCWPSRYICFPRERCRAGHLRGSGRRPMCVHSKAEARLKAMVLMWDHFCTTGIKMDKVSTKDDIHDILLIFPENYNIMIVGNMD